MIEENPGVYPAVRQFHVQRQWHGAEGVVLMTFDCDVPAFEEAEACFKTLAEIKISTIQL